MLYMFYTAKSPNPLYTLYTFLGRHSFSEGGYTAKPPTLIAP